MSAAENLSRWSAGDFLDGVAEGVLGTVKVGSAIDNERGVVLGVQLVDGDTRVEGDMSDLEDVKHAVAARLALELGYYLVPMPEEVSDGQ